MFIRLFRLSGELLQFSDLKLPRGMGSLGLAMGEAALLVSGFSPILIRRFRELKAHFGQHEGLVSRGLLRGLEFAAKLWSAPGMQLSDLSNVKIPGLNIPQLHLADRFFSTAKESRILMRFAFESFVKDKIDLHKISGFQPRVKNPQKWNVALLVRECLFEPLENITGLPSKVVLKKELSSLRCCP